MKIAPVLGAGVAALMLATAPAFAEMMNFTAELGGDNQTPPVETEATGTLEATYDTETMELTWTVEYEGLSGPATAAHFHGPATEEETAPPVVPAEGDLASPIEGSATLTEDQATMLTDGMMYFNVHTEMHGGGEIRGQVAQSDATEGDGAMESEAPAEGEMAPEGEM